MLRRVVAAVAIASVIAPASVDAHAKMLIPKPNGDTGGNSINNNPSALITGMSVLPWEGYSFGEDIKKNYEKFTAAFEDAVAKGKYKTLKDLVDAPGNARPEGSNTVECGMSKPEGDPQPLPDQVEWEKWHANSPSHEGPCEVWCDDERAFFDKNCVINFKDGKLPYDKSKCVGKKRLRSIWLALHVADWQVYVFCSTIGAGGAAGSGPAVTPPTPGATSPTPATTPPTPATTPPTPATTPPTPGATTVTTGGTTPTIVVTTPTTVPPSTVVTVPPPVPTPSSPATGITSGGGAAKKVCLVSARRVRRRRRR